MKGQDTEPTVGEIMFWYIKEKARNICKDQPHLPMELSSESKAQDKLGCFYMTRVRIAHHWKNDSQNIQKR